MGEVILRVPVLNGADAMIDSSDYELISNHKWRLTEGGYADLAGSFLRAWKVKTCPCLVLAQSC